MPSPVLLALALASSAAAPSPPLAEGPSSRPPELAGCAVAERDVAALTLDCPGVRFFVRVRGAGGADAFARGIVAGFKATAPQPVDEATTKVPLAERSLLATRVRTGDGRVLLVGVDAQPAATLILGCQALPGSEGRCTALLATLATMRLDDPRLGELPAAAQATFAGRALPTPEGCRLSVHAGGATIQCGGEAALSWLAVPDGREGVLDALIDGLSATLGFQGPERRTQPCAVEGLAATCRVLRNPAGGPPNLVGVEQVVRGTRMVVACIDGRAGPELPELCRSVLSLSAPAPSAADTAAPAAP
ncbi:hypothetical protein [Anaeromyxobacter sp. PSR-1]|uniref:hypothetical protein n=1 Tax=Anaeromyxobacter sp. PSR-1 TaxID=1300915 RepID=UPI001269C27D|nr:hypothetical protein [Anaeromyxobacter sp. PSR-1]